MKLPTKDLGKFGCSACVHAEVYDSSSTKATHVPSNWMDIEWTGDAWCDEHVPAEHREDITSVYAIARTALFNLEQALSSDDEDPHRRAVYRVRIALGEAMAAHHVATVEKASK